LPESNPDAPWLALPDITLPAELTPADTAAQRAFDGLFELPAGSALTYAEVNGDGSLTAYRWRETGTLGFYPASTIKWISVALTLRLMDEHDVPAASVLELDEYVPNPAADPAQTILGTTPGRRTLRDLILDTLVMSGNEAFNVLQETVGFAETHAALRSWGVEHSLIRRHFTRPHWNHSRPVTITRPDGRVVRLPARPPVNLPPNDTLGNPRTPKLDNPESNVFTTDDFVRVAAATLMGPTRRSGRFDLLTQGLGWTNQCYVREGLNRLTAERADRPGFVVLNKPGWWPPDGAHSELGYIHDLRRSAHAFLAVYIQGEQDAARRAMGDAARAIFGARHNGMPGD
jgi:hypothetical protein